MSYSTEADVISSTLDETDDTVAAANESAKKNDDLDMEVVKMNF